MMMAITTCFFEKLRIYCLHRAGRPLVLIINEEDCLAQEMFTIFLKKKLSCRTVEVSDEGDLFDGFPFQLTSLEIC